MTKLPKEYEEYQVDLQEIVRQQAEYITDLEMELAELTDKWQYLKEEIYDLQLQKEIEAEYDN